MKDTKGTLILLIAVAAIFGLLSFMLKNPQGEVLFRKLFPQVQKAGTATPSPVPNLKSLTIGHTVVMVQTADTDQTRQKGLGGVTNLPVDQGMLFVFTSKQITPSFWMKDMQIPLDFIWIGGGKVVEIDTNVPPPAPGTPDSQLKIYSPSKPIDYVLEVNAGFAMKNNIAVGNPVTGI